MILQYLVLFNFFVVFLFCKVVEILIIVNKKMVLVNECKVLVNEVEIVLKKYVVYNYFKYGKIYVFEVDGFGNYMLMDDVNVLSLLVMFYLGDVLIDDLIYQNICCFVWSFDNFYFFKGKVGEGIGGLYIGYDMVWFMSIMMKVFISKDDVEIKLCIEMLMNMDVGIGFMYEFFYKDNFEKFICVWFVWQNILFGELILKLVNEGKVDMLNSIQ